MDITKIFPEYELAVTVIHNSLIYSDSISLHVCETEREKKRKRETWRVSGGGQGRKVRRRNEEGGGSGGGGRV